MADTAGGHQQGRHDAPPSSAAGSTAVGGARRAAGPGGALDRRGFLRLAGLAAAAPLAGGALAACGSDSGTTPAGGTSGTSLVSGSGRALRIGYVSSRTGTLSGFGDTDAFVLDQMRQIFTRGVRVGADSHPVEIYQVDTQSDRNHAAEVTNSLIYDRQVDVVLVAGTSDVTIPVSDICEVGRVPCLSSVTPWDTWFFGRGGQLTKPFAWTYHIFGGTGEIITVFQDMWGQLETNKKIGALFPRDASGDRYSNGRTGFPPAIARSGYTLLPPIRFPDLTGDFGNQITQFRTGGAQIMLATPLPADFAAFWKQAVAAGYRPKMATVAKALLFPTAVEDVGPSADGVCSDVRWSPHHRFTSSITGQSAQVLADAYEKKTGRQWTQPLGFAHALFEVLVTALAKVTSLDDRAQLAKALGQSRTDSVVGPVRFGAGAGVPANVAPTRVVGGQWRLRSGNRFDLVIVSSAYGEEIPAASRIRPLPGAVA